MLYSRDYVIVTGTWHATDCRIQLGWPMKLTDWTGCRYLTLSQTTWQLFGIIMSDIGVDYRTMCEQLSAV